MPVGATSGGLVFSLASGADVNQGQGATGANAQTNGGTGLRESSRYNQLLFSQTNLVHEVAFDTEQVASTRVAHEFSVNGDPTFTPDGHAVEPQLDAGLLVRQHELVLQVRGEQALESDIGDNGTFVDHRAIGVADFDIGLQTAAPGSNGASADVQILDLEKVPLLPFESRPNFIKIPAFEGPYSPYSQPAWVRARTNRIRMRVSMNPP
jgi:hypothetical protein